MLPERKARLLLESSQASPPSSIVSFHKGTANLTDSTVSLLFSATVLPSASTSLPPHDHRYGYHHPGASPKVCPAVGRSGGPSISISCRHRGTCPSSPGISHSRLRRARICG